MVEHKILILKIFSSYFSTNTIHISMNTDGESKKNEDWRTESNGPGGIAQYLRAELWDVTLP